MSVQLSAYGPGADWLHFQCNLTADGDRVNDAFVQTPVAAESGFAGTILSWHGAVTFSDALGTVTVECYAVHDALATFVIDGQLVILEADPEAATP